MWYTIGVMGSTAASFKHEVRRLCRGDVYREGSAERAHALSSLCATWLDGAKAAYPLARSPFTTPPAIADAIYGLSACAHDAAVFDNYFYHGRLRLACASALLVAKSHPAVLATASRFLQRRVP